MNVLSSTHRSSVLQRLESEEFDLLIIGGGITGAGIALDASLRGIKTALIEKQDFAAGTSSRSTKLIHGGLRYLKHWEIGLVREMGRERTILHQIAPNLVVPEKMLLPLVKRGPYRTFIASMGLMIYDFLAGVKKTERRVMLSKNETLETETLLRKEIITGGGLYWEYRTDDARLTLEVLKTSADKGATPVNYVEGQSFIYTGKRVSGMNCMDILKEKRFSIHARVIVNAAGPWVDQIRQKDPESPLGENNFKKEKNKLRLTRGIHIVVSMLKFPLKHSVYFPVVKEVTLPAWEGRMVFAIPRGKITYIGTTDTDYTGNLENPTIEKKDVDYLLSATNYIFPSIGLKNEDVLSGWSGVRPLIDVQGKLPSELSRKDEIVYAPSGLISIAGGKLTGYRKMAEKIVNKVSEVLHKKYQGNKEKCTTAFTPLSCCIIPDSNLVSYISKTEKTILPFDLSIEDAEYLVKTFGNGTEWIVARMQSMKDINPQLRMARAELVYCLHFEALFHLSDFFLRRTSRLLFDIHSVPKLLEPLLEDMKNYYFWDKSRVMNERREVEGLMKFEI